MKDDAMNVLAVERLLFFEQLDQVPGDGLTFSIRVSREIESVGLLQRFHYRLNVFFVALDDLVLHRETVLGFDGAFFWHQIPDMTIGCENLEILAEVLLDGFRLCGRFNNYQILRHSSLM